MHHAPGAGGPPHSPAEVKRFCREIFYKNWVNAPKNKKG
nr:MAG TPA: hypothetical protein [Caudoviricetes sp.]